MRTVFVASLALLLVALPATEAAACRCEAETSEASCGCCCAQTDRACSCCPAEEEEKPTALVEACSCSQTAPQAPAPETDELPAAGAPDTPRAADAPASTGRAYVAATAERRSPHPTVTLPLLL